MEVTSCIDGRIRIRNADLKEPSLAEAVGRKLRDCPEVRTVTANCRTGSLLIIYDRVRTTVKKILSTLARFFGLDTRSDTASVEDPERGTTMRPYLSRRRLVNLGMLVSLIISLGGAILDAKNLHIIAGLIFVVIFGLHLFDKRRSLLA